MSYDGKAITYDELGRPLNYMGAAMAWDVNGNLITVKSGTDAISYTYLSGGQRGTKTVNGKKTEYHYNNGMLLSETTGDETLRYYYDSAGRVASIAYKKGTNAEVSYFFARNLHGDVIAVYRSSDSKLIGTYEYDLWGRPISVKEASAGIDTDGILQKNPIRYRSYYYDSETGFYNLNLRYYDPDIRRFISSDSMDLLLVDFLSINCKNLFNYCENNPVNGKDSTGAYVETPLDLATWGISVAEVCVNPTDVGAWIGVGLDTVDLLIPAGGLGEVYKAGRIMKKASQANDMANAADTVGDTYKASKTVGNAIEGGTRLIPNAEDLKMSQTVQNHMNDIIKKGPNAGQLSRPYIDSNGTTLLLKEIMESADPVQDTVLESGLRWDVEGTFRGSTGIWELVVDTSTNTVVHFNFVTQ